MCIPVGRLKALTPPAAVLFSALTDQDRIATMTTLRLQIPEEAFKALKLPPGRAEEELQHEFAVFLVKEGLLDPAHARTVARMGRVEFQDLLARRKVEWSASPDDALHDLATARAAVRFDSK